MIKVLLVDDEKLALEYLEHMIDWSYYGFELIGTTTNPEQALMIYRNYRPELVITDVKMPGISGLDLGSVIREYGDNTHILFLSAYKNFDYVKQAIRLGIDDYILKSDLEENSFLKKILKIKDEINKEKAKKQYTISSVLEEIFQKNISEETYKDILDENDYICLYKKYYYMVITKRTVPYIFEKYFPQEKRTIVLDKHLLKMACDNIAIETGIRMEAGFTIGEREYLILLNPENAIISQKEIHEKIFQFARGIFNKINENEKLFNVYYCLCKNSVRRFGTEFEEYRGQFDDDFLEEKAQILELKIRNDRKEKETIVKVPSTDDLYYQMQQGAGEWIERWMRDLEKLSNEKESGLFFKYVENMMDALSFFDGKLIGETSKQKFLLTESSSMFDFRYSSDIRAYLEYKIEEIGRMKNEKEKMLYSDVTINAMEYIHHNYSNAEITASKVAEYVGVTSSWLSTKFKTETGIKVNDFINNVRIENAKKMFREKDYMIYEVSEKTGFTSSQYFSKVFKEYTGYTPNQYRRKLYLGEHES